MKNIKQILSIFLILLAACQSGFAQYEYQGAVYDRTTGLGIEGVSVHSGKRTVMTDSLGQFAISTDRLASELRFQRIGYRIFTLEVRPQAPNLRVFLEPDHLLIEEVEVNTGYQFIPRERATGSFVYVGRAQLEAVPGRSILDKLDGIMPGLQFDRRAETHTSSNPGPDISIRGLNTFNLNTSKPLIVVDNFPFEGDLESIHPDDIESVTMLRDAAATSIWGARAGNGVLVITLRKADMEGHTSVSVSSNISVTAKPDLYSPSSMTSSEFVDVEQSLYAEGFYTPSLTGSNVRYFIFSPVVQALFDHDQQRIDKQELDRIIAEARTHDYRDEMLRYFYRNVVSGQHSASISKQIGPYSYQLSAGLNQTEGIGNLVGDKSKKTYSFRLGNSYRFSNRLQAELDLRYSHSSEVSSGGSTYPLQIGGGRGSAYPYLRLVDEQGSGLKIPMGLNPRYVDTITSIGLLDWSFNPMEDQHFLSTLGTSSFLSPTVTLRYSVFESLNIEAIYGGTFRSGKSEIEQSVESYQVRNEINRFTQISGGRVLRPIPLGGFYSKGTSDLIGHRIRFQTRLDRNLFSFSRLNLLLGSEISDVATESDSYRVYGYDPYLKLSVPVDHVTQFPLFSGGSSAIPRGQLFNRTDKRLVSIFANASYAFFGRYVVSGSVRKDASNAFGVKANERWNPLWSVGLSWDLNQEGFLEDIKWVSKLRIRTTHGHSGNLGGGTTSDRVIIRYSAAADYTGLPYAVIETPSNPSLKWEDVQMQNFGIEVGLFGGKINGGFEYYRKTVTDLISRDPLDKTTGFSNMVKNVGGIKGEGWDITLEGHPFVRSFQWHVSASVSHAQDWVTVYKGTISNTSTTVGNTGMTIRPMEGKPLMPVYSYRFAGLDGLTGDPLGYLDGEISKNYSRLLNDSLQNLNYHGSGRPLYFGFLNNTFEYGGLSLWCNVAFRAGHYYKTNTISYSSLFNSWETHGDYARRWQQPGDEQYTTVPSMVYPANSSRDLFYQHSEATIAKADLIRLQQVRVSYRIARPLRMIRTLDFGVHVNNLGILWKASPFDKDPDFQSIPPARTVSIQLKVNL